MTKVVLDTNVVVSAFLTPGGNPAMILESVLRNELIICFNTAILTEYEEVLCRPKFANVISKTVVQRFFDLVNEIGTRITCAPCNIDFIDEKDRKFYDVALNEGAILITGNKKHFPDECFIYEPADFIKSL